MARIRILTPVSGTDFQWSPGQVVDLPGATASQWADGVRAEMVRDEPVNKSVGPAHERTVRRSRKTAEEA